MARGKLGSKSRSIHLKAGQYSAKTILGSAIIRSIPDGLSASQNLSFTKREGGLPMKQLIRSGAAALAIAGLMLISGGAQAQQPQLYDGIVVPTSNVECNSTTPIFWPATYRPYVTDAASGVNQPSQLVVIHNHGRNGMGLRLTNTAAGQFNGNTDKSAGFNIVFEDVQDNTKSNTGSQPPGASGRTIHMVQVPNNVTALDVPANRWIKITGTIVQTSDGTSPGLFCAKSIVGVFVRRPH